MVPGDVLEQQQAFNPGQTSKGYPSDLKLLQIPPAPQREAHSRHAYLLMSHLWISSVSIS